MDNLHTQELTNTPTATRLRTWIEYKYIWTKVIWGLYTSTCILTIWLINCVAAAVGVWYFFVSFVLFYILYTLLLVSCIGRMLKCFYCNSSSNNNNSLISIITTSINCCVCFVVRLIWVHNKYVWHAVCVNRSISLTTVFTAFIHHTSATQRHDYQAISSYCIYRSRSNE